MNALRMYEQLNEATARMEAVIFLAGMLASQSAPDVLRELLREEDARVVAALFPDMPDDIGQELDAGDYGVDLFTEWALLTNKLGFVVKFATPVVRTTRGSPSYSWGSYYTHWVYADTLDQAVTAGLKWVQERRTAEAAKTTAAGRGDTGAPA